MSWEQLTLWSEGALASPSPQLETDGDLKTQEASLCMTTYEWLKRYGRNGSSGKMYQVSYPKTTDRPLAPSSGKWLSSGIVSAGECWTLNTLESPSVDIECSLSDILVPIESVQQKYYLTQRAAAGILRRAELRNKKLPPPLKQALQLTANFGHKTASSKSDT